MYLLPLKIGLEEFAESERDILLLFPDKETNRTIAITHRPIISQPSIFIYDKGKIGKTNKNNLAAYVIVTSS